MKRLSHAPRGPAVWAHLIATVVRSAPPLCLVGPLLKIPRWELRNGEKGPLVKVTLPLPRLQDNTADTEVENIPLVPYDFTHLRLTIIPGWRV